MNYAVIDGKSKWILSIHGRRDLAEARLRAYISGAMADGTCAAVAPFLPPGTGATGMLPHLRVVGVESFARAKSYYSGEITERRTRLPTKKAG